MDTERTSGRLPVPSPQQRCEKRMQIGAKYQRHGVSPSLWSNAIRMDGVLPDRKENCSNGSARPARALDVAFLQSPIAKETPCLKFRRKRVQRSNFDWGEIAIGQASHLSSSRSIRPMSTPTGSCMRLTAQMTRPYALLKLKCKGGRPLGSLI